MRTAVFSTKLYDRQFLSAAAGDPPRHEFTFLEPRLTRETAALAQSHEAVCPFVNDKVDGRALEILQAGGTRFIALRSAGYNHVDLEYAASVGITVGNVAYSPDSVADYTLMLMLMAVRNAGANSVCSAKRCHTRASTALSLDTTYTTGPSSLRSNPRTSLGPPA